MLITWGWVSMIILSAKIHLERPWVGSFIKSYHHTDVSSRRYESWPLSWAQLGWDLQRNGSHPPRLPCCPPPSCGQPGQAGRRARRPRLLRCLRPRHSWAGEHTTPPGSPAWPRGGICPRDSVSALADFADNYEKTVYNFIFRSKQKCFERARRFLSSFF